MVSLPLDPQAAHSRVGISGDDGMRQGAMWADGDRRGLSKRKLRTNANARGRRAFGCKVGRFVSFSHDAAREQIMNRGL